MLGASVVTPLHQQPSNTLPLPALARRNGVASAPALAASRDDRFPKGRIVKYFPHLSYGFVRDHIGRELFFHVDEVDLLGPRGRKDCIQVGAEIGYDCCRTSHGLRVKRMKIY